MRIGLFLFLFPMMAYAGCPVGVLTDNISASTSLPHCVKMSHSSLGGCYVNCPGVCVVYDGLQGPIHSTGVECTPGGGDGGSDNDGGGGSDNGGDAGGDDNGTDTGGSDGNNSGNGPIGGPTDGMSVGRVTPMLVGDKSVADIAPGFNAILADLWLIKHAATRTEDSTRGIFENSIKMQQDISRIVHSSGSLSNIFSQSMGESNYYLKSILEKVGADSGANSGPNSDSDGQSKDYWDEKFDLVFGKFDLARANLYDIRMNTGSVIGEIFAIHGALGANGMAGQVMQMNETMQNLAAAISGGSIGNNTGGTAGGADKSSEYLKEINEVVGYMANDVRMLAAALPDGSGNGSGNGGGDGSGGVDIDYSKMPGSESTPLSVRSASYDSRGCEGGANCFFDVPTMQGKLDEANNALTGSYKAISEDMKRIFSFNFYGSAEPMKCLDLFSLYGKDYSVCPPSADFWSTLAALMMFIFYFVALMVIFKR